MMALPSLWVASGEAPAQERFANVHYRRAFLLLRRKSELSWTRVISRLSHFDMAKTKVTNLTPGLTFRPCPSGGLSDGDCGARAPIGYAEEHVRETMGKASRSNPYIQRKAAVDRQ